MKVDIQKLENLKVLVEIMKQGTENKLKDNFNCFDFEDIEIEETKETLIAEWDMLETISIYLNNELGRKE